MKKQKSPRTSKGSPKARKPVPFEFVLERLASYFPSNPLLTRPMFGCLAVYVDEKIYFVLREKDDDSRDNGIWIATTREHHSSLKKDFPALRSIWVLASGKPTGWQLIPSESADFEEKATLLCELIAKGDPRIGKTPDKKKAKKSKRE